MEYSESIYIAKEEIGIRVQWMEYRWAEYNLLFSHHKLKFLSTDAHNLPSGAPTFRVKMTQFIVSWNSSVKKLGGCLASYERDYTKRKPREALNQVMRSAQIDPEINPYFTDCSLTPVIISGLHMKWPCRLDVSMPPERLLGYNWESSWLCAPVTLTITNVFNWSNSVQGPLCNVACRIQKGSTTEIQYFPHHHGWEISWLCVVWLS